ncbi:Hypp2514 [Branchiostoma lanceolatum]|uniref:Hypp2514 protein n=1 Tax=Branchiostoma lanceolatum TaxID=7740 RepID=A0A8J9ZUD4_BRALA|nr:Hypp2514 [Branchiostoma lanceolatum]
MPARAGGNLSPSWSVTGGTPPRVLALPCALTASVNHTPRRDRGDAAVCACDAPAIMHHRATLSVLTAPVISNQPPARGVSYAE